MLCVSMGGCWRFAGISGAGATAVKSGSVERLVATAYSDSLALLDANRPALDALAARLLDTRELDRIDIVTALSPFAPERVAG